MNKLKFAAALRKATTRCRIDPVKARLLPSEDRNQVTLHIVRNRGPLATCLLPDTVDEQWLNAMGYMYVTTSAKTGLEFRHTCEHSIQ